jgi:fatty-acyl-CoA synthase
VHLVHSLFTGSPSVIHCDGASISANEVAADGARLASHLCSMGLAPGDRIAVWAANGIGYLRLLAAAAAGRFVLVSVNTRWSVEEASALVVRSGARLVVTDRSPAELARIDAEALPIDDVETWRNEAPVRLDEAGPHDPFVVFTTSGTTSDPKMVLHDQRSITVHAHDVAHSFGYDQPASRVLVAMPLCGVFGFCSLTGAVAGGAEIWLQSSFDAESTGSVIEAESIVSANGSDDMFHRLLATGHDLSSLELCGYARFNSSLDGVVARAEAAGFTMTGLYGMSEVQALFALRDPSDPALGREKAGGRPVSVSAGVRVVDPDSGAECPVGVEGELLVRGPSLFAGYLAEGGNSIDSDLTSGAGVVDSDGDEWFRTGDLGLVGADGSFTYTTRMGDVLRLGGFLVSPAEIESVVLEVAGVEAAQVVAVPRPGGVRPVAFVIADGPVSESDVVAHCREHLAIFKCPVAVIEVDEFPTTPSANGTKIQRNKLRELALARLA